MGNEAVEEERKERNLIIYFKNILQFVTSYVYTRNNIITINGLRYTLHSLNFVNRWPMRITDNNDK